MEKVEQVEPKWDKVPDIVFDEKETPWFNPEESKEKLNEEKRFVERDKNKGGFRYIISLPEGMLSECLKYAVKEVLKGNFSPDLPVKYNGTYSSLDMMTLYSSYVPQFIEKVLSTDNLLE